MVYRNSKKMHITFGSYMTGFIALGVLVILGGTALVAYGKVKSV